MKMILFRCSFVAVIIFIPLTSIQHFIPPLSDCLLADICNHTWIPECGEDQHNGHLRLFIDECDVYEYNCDYDVNCFGPVTCPTLPHFKTTEAPKDTGKLLRIDRRRLTDVVYNRRTTLPMKPITGKRRYTPERGRMKRRMFQSATTACSPCMRTQPSYKPSRRVATKRTRKRHKITTKRKTRKTTKRTTKRKFTSTRLTITQVIRTGTKGTVVLKRVTVIKNGMMLFKVVKGYETVTTPANDGSDFLE